MSKIKPLYDNIRLNCTIVSDTHIDIKHPMPWLPKFHLKQAISQSQKSASPVDAFITIGDTTSRGSEINWKLTEECFAGKDPAEKILLAVGNHDTWNDDGYDAALEQYYIHAGNICGVKRSKPYFSAIINGYRLVFLGSERDCGCGAYISDEQIAWLKSEIQAARESGKPVFVFCHQSLNQRHGLPVTWDKDERYDNLSEGGIGDKSDEVAEVLKSGKNVWYFSGHSHMGLGGENLEKEKGYASFDTEDGLELVNFPSLACGNHHGEDLSFGIGMQLEVYDDRVVIRPRNYTKHKWNKKVSIKDGKPYFEKML